jgi:hypothetical protein
MENTRKSREQREDMQVRLLVKALAKRGLTVRREKLARGLAFRVKSGNCLLSGDTLLFVDRRLPPKQQFSVLLDYVIDQQITLESDELDGFDDAVRSLMRSRIIQQTAAPLSVQV